MKSSQTSNRNLKKTRVHRYNIELFIDANPKSDKGA